MSELALVAVIETPEFLAATRKLMDDESRAALITRLAGNPTAGDLIQGTGGVRKLRRALAGRGKSGGARIIYFYYNHAFPLYMLTAYAKAARENLSQADRNEFRRMTTLLIESDRKAQR